MREVSAQALESHKFRSSDILLDVLGHFLYKEQNER